MIEFKLSEEEALLLLSLLKLYSSSDGIRLMTWIRSREDVINLCSKLQTQLPIHELAIGSQKPL